jgi:hypothetical protein
MRAAGREIRKAHPEVLGVGLGVRRSQGRVRHSDLVFKIYVENKFGERKPKETKRIPKIWRLHVGKSKRIVIHLPTDIEEVMEFAPSSFDVGPMKAASWISWFDSGNRPRVGVITAAHGLRDVGVAVAIAGIPNGGTVAGKADLSRDQLDVGLVEISPSDVNYPDTGPRNAELTSADSLINLIGTSSTDGLSTQCEHWAETQTVPVRALAFMATYPIKYPDGTMFSLRNVILGDGYVGAFKPGYSGASWATQAPSSFDRIIAIQSHGRSPSFDVGIGTHFASAVDWLISAMNLQQTRLWWRRTAADAGTTTPPP